MTNSAIPLFYLYGEPHQRVTADFVHIEPLEDRTRPQDWRIRDHVHIDLNHIFHVASGGGELQVEHKRLSYAAPALLIVPAGNAHGFLWQRESSGAVVTIATAHLRQLVARDSDLSDLFDVAAVLRIPVADEAAVSATVTELAMEYRWAKPGYRAAIEASLLDLLVRALRCCDPHVILARAVVGPQSALVARFRERVEQCFRSRESVEQYADALAISPYQLRAACKQVVSMSPSAIMDQRTVLEAKRALIYSSLTIGEIAFSLGFADASYFARFFYRHVGTSPRNFKTKVFIERNSIVG